ncbi:MAG: metallophosphoesterase family protein [Candidatus Competibacteraceae bacterium]
MNSEIAVEALEILGTIDATRGIGRDIITRTVTGQTQTLSHGQEFTGRPVTQITADEHHVIKWRSEYQFNAKDSRRWIERMLEKERRYGVHHPAKTWFTTQHAGRTVIANITPKLLPLHMAHRSLEPSALLTHMASLADMYFRAAATFNIKLDEGLSNFGVDAQGNLYYLDDDIYKWDQFTSLASMLGVWFRQLTWLEPEQARQLGILFRVNLLKHFADSHWLSVIGRQLNSLFFANEAQVLRKQQFVAGFNQPKKPTASKKPTAREHHMADERFAILGDIHANYPALQAVFKQLDQWGIRDGIVLGDTVGYGPHPQECIQALQARDFLVIKGNHDHALVTGVPARGFSALGRWVLEWSTDRLDAPERDWLAALPVFHQQDEWYAAWRTVG